MEKFMPLPELQKRLRSHGVKSAKFAGDGTVSNLTELRAWWKKQITPRLKIRVKWADGFEEETVEPTMEELEATNLRLRNLLGQTEIS